MCRNIKPLFNFEPPANAGDVRASALQYVRKVSGYTRPSKANEAAFQRAVDEIADATARLLDSLVTDAPARSRELEIARAKARSAERYGRAPVAGGAADAAASGSAGAGAGA